jgi:hypothetical protein
MQKMVMMIGTSSTMNRQPRLPNRSLQGWLTGQAKVELSNVTPGGDRTSSWLFRLSALIPQVDGITKVKETCRTVYFQLEKLRVVTSSAFKSLIQETP